jgi:hypothetical protein
MAGCWTRRGAVVALTLVCAGCRYDLDRIPSYSDPADGGAGDASRQAVASVPGPPQTAVAGGTIDFVAALRRFDFGETDVDGEPGYLAIGFDLDGTYTLAGEADRCAAPQWAGNHPDGPGGRDNSAGAVTYLNNLLGYGSLMDFVTAFVELGRFTLALQVRDYNGERDDAAVEVSWRYVTRIGLEAAAGQAPSHDAGTDDELRARDGQADLRWDGRDRWLPLALDEPRGGLPAPERSTDSAAYVTAFTLVARFAAVYTTIGTILHAVVSARVVQTQQGWALREGTFAGRIESDNHLSGLDYQTNSAGEPLCTDAVGYGERKRVICALADVNSQAIDDGSAPCDASSWAIGFAADPIELGPPASWNVFAPSALCEDPARLPSADGCATLAPGG